MQHDKHTDLHTKIRMFRPSEVEHFAFCPTYWQLKKARWYPRMATRAMITASWSTAAHAAFALYWRMKLDGVTDQTHLLTAAQSEASKEWLNELSHYNTFGVNYGTLDIDVWDADLHKLIENYHKHCRFNRSGWQVLTVEEPLDDEGNTRPDVVAIDPDGLIVPVDYKIKHQVNPKWFDHQGWADEQQYSHKQLDYIHRLSLKPAYKPKMPRYRHYLYAITADPFAQLLTPYDISEEYMDRWHYAAINHWHNMAGVLSAGDYRHPTHKSPYGMCELLAACTKHDLDTARMVFDYVQVPKRKEKW